MPLPEPQNPVRVLAIANQKGGVGKTTTAVNLATALAAVGRKVVVFDLDPQGNASTGLDIPAQDRKSGAYEVLFGELSLTDALRPTLVPGLSIVPASPDLAGAELELVDKPRREYFLDRALEDLPDGTDYVLIDCPPSLGLLTLNALTAARDVLVPLQCEFYALEGLSHLTRTIERVRRTMNPSLGICGVVLTMYDRRNRLSEQVEADVRGVLGETVFTTVIPRNVRISEAPSHGRPVILYDLKSAGAQAYVQLARELLKREKTRKMVAA
ncbi:MAG: ParA family protein [Pseudomonadota bacterium]|nr:ParA family protein [Pseudomonadota bacterium]